MNVSLTPELEKLVHAKVESGLNLSASEVVREALRLLEERDRLKALRFEELRKEIQIGIGARDLPGLFESLREKSPSAPYGAKVKLR